MATHFRHRVSPARLLLPKVRRSTGSSQSKIREVVDLSDDIIQPVDFLDDDPVEILTESRPRSAPAAMGTSLIATRGSGSWDCGGEISPNAARYTTSCSDADCLGVSHERRRPRREPSLIARRRVSRKAIPGSGRSLARREIFPCPSALGRKAARRPPTASIAVQSSSAD